MKLSWIPTSNAPLSGSYYISCTPEMYCGNYPEDLTYLCTSTSVLLKGFQEGIRYLCTVSTLSRENNLQDESISVDFNVGKHQYLS